MASTGLNGPHELTEKNIDDNVSASIGAYALGHVDSGTFYVDYVGRSDTDLNDRLKDWVGTKYKSFKYDHFNTKKAAFEKECHMFHDFGGTQKLDNKIHPDRAEGASWECPVCNIFD